MVKQTTTTTYALDALCCYKSRMTAVPIPTHELKRNAWYYGVRCACARLLALAEDCLRGNGEDHHLSAVPLEVQCECGAVTHTQVLKKFKTP